jgi:hypothetical protein
MVSAYDNLVAEGYAEHYPGAYATGCAETFARAVAAPGTEEYAAAYADAYAEAYREAKAEVEAPGFAEALAQRRAAKAAARELVTERKITAMLAPRTRAAIVSAYDGIYADGEAHGELNGRRATLAKLLRLKFGARSDLVRAHLKTADQASLDRWTERLLFATTLEQIFGA